MSRRSFLATAGAGVAGLAAGTASADSTVENANRAAMTDEYEFVFDRTQSGDRIPTLINVFDGRVLSALESYGTDVRLTEEPWPAMYARLTPSEAADVSEYFLVTRMRFAPGANPFWKHFEYPDRVFPAPEAALDYVAYEEAVDGLTHLAEAHPDRARVKTFGNSAGLENRREGEPVQYDMVIAELTNGIDDVEDKEVVAYSLAIHGDERSGLEAGVRLFEAVLRGEEPELDSWLDDVALVFVLSNPDGWVSRHPETVSSAHSGRDTFTRANGSALDLNRQFPTAGVINPNAYPADPYGENLENDDPDGIDDDVADVYVENVPDALWLVHELRRYDDVAYAADFHGMYGASALVYNMHGNSEYSVREQAAIDALNERTEDAYDADIRPLLNEYSQELNEAAQNRGVWGGAPSEPYAFGTVSDTIDYNVSGSMGGWLGKAVDVGGFGATAVTYEMAIDNSQTAQPIPYYPILVTVQLEAYQICMRELARLAAEPVDGSIETGGRSLAYVDTPTLTRRSDDLTLDSRTAIDRDRLAVATERNGGRSISIGRDAHTLSVSVEQLETGVESAALVSPSGETVRTDDVHGSGCCGGAEWIVTDPEPGRWELRVDGDGAADVTLAIVSTTGRPDPGALNYQQREYEVTPLAYFEDYGDAMADGTASGLTVAEIEGGALLSGGQPAYDDLVISHDDGTASGAYVSAIEEYVDAGGNLVLTDAGVSLLASLDVGGANSIGSSDVTSRTVQFASLGSTTGHPLVDDVRSLEAELWTGPTLGYAISNEAPITVVDESAFANAGGDVAATAGGDVIVGELGSITVIGGLLPPATQSNLHPFGLEDYALTPMGMRILRAALGHEQRI
ncbi:M14 family zinc carboxypeptidase [Halovivax gelatinilyticus]|uniref:M14 family zinc carboxypeptidase n=1 Tax=Halovivax gelatinilyticus TaxID=2961597 RepID=UPI0020CA95F0|nr:M14 family zinc carboxypeptidase [Halovivax gelatinilyticus]